jgi:hypothetical protein
MDKIDLTPEKLASQFREFDLTKRVQFGRLTIVVNREGILKVVVYSKWYHQENVTQTEAENDLKAAKEFVAEICSKSEDFKNAFKNYPVEYEFCFDYGTAAVLLYRLVGDKVESAVKKK